MPEEILNFDESQYTDEFIKNLYNKEFFQRNYRDKRHNNLNMARILYEYFKFSSVVDFGCGIGSYLEIFKSRGCEVRGFEYGFQQSKELYSKVGLTTTEVSFGDVTQKIILNKKYDVALSVEVAEHIPTSKSDILVSNLVSNATELIIFSAAKKGQGGTGHINCQNTEFWLDLFSNHGWFSYDIENLKGQMVPVRDKNISESNYVWAWVFDNLMVFKK